LLFKIVQLSTFGKKELRFIATVHRVIAFFVLSGICPFFIFCDFLTRVL
jgi:hypothetical protein